MSPAKVWQIDFAIEHKQLEREHVFLLPSSWYLLILHFRPRCLENFLENKKLFRSNVRWKFGGLFVKPWYYILSVNVSYGYKRSVMFFQTPPSIRKSRLFIILCNHLNLFQFTRMRMPITNYLLRDNLTDNYLFGRCSLTQLHVAASVGQGCFSTWKTPLPSIYLLFPFDLTSNTSINTSYHSYWPISLTEFTHA